VDTGAAGLSEGGLAWPLKEVAEEAQVEASDLQYQ